MERAGKRQAHNFPKVDFFFLDRDFQFNLQYHSISSEKDLIWGHRKKETTQFGRVMNRRIVN